MILYRRFRVLSLQGATLILLLAAALPVSADECLKTIWEHYCLEGDINALLKAKPDVATTQARNEHYAAVYLEGQERVYVLSYRTVIYKVLRSYTNSTEIKFKDLMKQLEEAFGEPQDFSTIDMNKVSAARRLGMVRRGEGQVRYVWMDKGSPWRAELTWTKELGIAVAYFSNVLDAEQKKAMEAGL